VLYVCHVQAVLLKNKPFLLATSGWLFTTREHNYLEVEKGCVATDLRQHFFTERVINIWNYLDPPAVEDEILNTFRSKLQKLRDKDGSFLDVIYVLLTP